MVKRILRKHGYPPDKEKKATDTVLEQATLLCRDWARAQTVSKEKKDVSICKSIKFNEIRRVCEDNFKQ